MPRSTGYPNILLLPDGNRRWAFKKETTPDVGYNAGARRVAECVAYLGDLGVKQCWVGLTRPSNHERAPENVSAILDACVRVYEIGLEEERPFNVIVGGQLQLLPPEHKQRLENQQNAEYLDDCITANLLFGWSGEYEADQLVQAARDNPQMNAHDLLISASPIKEHVDLVIRTGMREHTGRLSGMIPLHSLDAELYLPSTLFPDFSSAHLGHAIEYWADRYPPNL